MGASGTATPKLGRYGGISGQERLVLRRTRLLDAGLDLFGTDGYAQSSVKAVCERAGLTERYFYESFKTREDLLFAVYEQIVEEVARTSLEAVADADPTPLARARAGLGAFFAVLTGDPRKGRVLSLEVVGVSERLERRRRQTMHDFAAFIGAVAQELAGPDQSPALDRALTAMALVGGTNELLIEWLLDPQRGDPGRLVEQTALMFEAVFGAAFGSAPRVG